MLFTFTANHLWFVSFLYITYFESLLFFKNKKDQNKYRAKLGLNIVWNQSYFLLKLYKVLVQID